MPYVFHVAIYNSAGERVRELYDGHAELPASGFELDRLVLAPGQPGITATFPGRLQDGSDSLLWDGLNDNGQPVAGGSYTFKVDQKDPFGAETSFVLGVEALPPYPPSSLRIYNSAGERVATLSLDNLTLPGRGVTGLRLPTDVLILDGSPTPWFKVTDSNGVEQNLSWDGRNAQGALVNAGTYVAELVSEGDGGRTLVETKSFTVLRAPESKSTVVLAPNPVQGEGPIRVVYSALPAGQSAVARLYNMAGELIGQAGDPDNDGVIEVWHPGMASGIYVVVFEAWDGFAVVQRNVLKAAVKR